jgi:S1-C subfamily serine protease
LIASAAPFNAGTGFFVSAEGDFVSAYHVIGDCRRPAILTPAGLLAARTVAGSATYDLAVARTEARPLLYAVFAGYGQRIAPTSWWVARFRACGGLGSRSIVEARQIPLPSGWDHLLAIEAADPIEGGNSGSPLIDGQGAIVGMVIARATEDARSALAVDAITLKGFLLGAGVRFETATENLPLPDGLAGALASQYTFPVHCLY